MPSRDDGQALQVIVAVRIFSFSSTSYFSYVIVLLKITTGNNLILLLQWPVLQMQLCRTLYTVRLRDLIKKVQCVRSAVKTSKSHAEKQIIGKKTNGRENLKTIIGFSEKKNSELKHRRHFN